MAENQPRQFNWLSLGSLCVHTGMDAVQKTDALYEHNQGCHIASCVQLAWFNGGDFVWETGPNRTLCGLDSFIGKQEGAVSENAQAHIICPWEAPLQLTRMQASDSSAEQQQQQHSVANDADRAAAAGKTDLTASSAVALEVPDTEDTTLAWAVAALAAAEEADGDGRQQQAVQEYLLSNMNGNSNSTTTNAVGRGSRDSSLGEQAVEQEQ
eukprot:scaffold56904_cov17-Tisochrysis_lutea.AAC.1